MKTLQELLAQGLSLREVGERIGKYNPRRETTRQLLLRAVKNLIPTQPTRPDTYQPTHAETQQWAAFIIAQLTWEFVGAQANIRSRVRPSMLTRLLNQCPPDETPEP